LRFQNEGAPQPEDKTDAATGAGSDVPGQDAPPVDSPSDAGAAATAD
jgi:hypothetical protein